MPGPTWAHGKDTYVSIDGKDISKWTNTSELGKKAETHNVTMYGTTAYADGRKPNEYYGGLVDATFKAGGVYDTTTSTGTAAIKSIEGKLVALIRRPLGTGTGKPEQTVQIIVTSYTESNPVADMVTWQLEAQCSGVISESTQA